jgi:hypothetical protein
MTRARRHAQVDQPRCSAGHMYGTYDAPAISDMNGDGKPEIIVGARSSTATAACAARACSAPAPPTSAAHLLRRRPRRRRHPGGRRRQRRYTPGHRDLVERPRRRLPRASPTSTVTAEPEIVVNSSGKVRLQTPATARSSGSVEHPRAGLRRARRPSPTSTATACPRSASPAAPYTVFDTDGKMLWRRPPRTPPRASPAPRSTTSRATASPTSSTPTRSTCTCSPAPTARSSSSTPNTTAARPEYPVVADVDNDGQVEIVVVSDPYNGRPHRLLRARRRRQLVAPRPEDLEPARLPHHKRQRRRHHPRRRRPSTGSPTTTSAPATSRPPTASPRPTSCWSRPSRASALCSAPDSSSLWVQLGNARRRPADRRRRSSRSTAPRWASSR